MVKYQLFPLDGGKRVPNQVIPAAESDSDPTYELFDTQGYLFWCVIVGTIAGLINGFFYLILSTHPHMMDFSRILKRLALTDVYLLCLDEAFISLSSANTEVDVPQSIPCEILSMIVVLSLTIITISYVTSFMNARRLHNFLVQRHALQEHLTTRLESEFKVKCSRKTLICICMRLVLVIFFHILFQAFWWMFLSGVTNLDQQTLASKYEKLVQLLPVVNSALNLALYFFTWFTFSSIVLSNPDETEFSD